MKIEELAHAKTLCHSRSAGGAGGTRNTKIAVAMRVSTTFFVAIGLSFALCRNASADAYADAVESYKPVINESGEPTPPHRNAESALGAPDYDGAACSDPRSCQYVSLGSGGALTLQFMDNALTGSGNSDPDLFIYEIGPDLEDTFVEISADNVTYFPVGKVLGSTSTVDIDAFGFGAGDTFVFVRLTDDPAEGSQGGSTVGADIDAVEALTSLPTAVKSTSWSRIKAVHWQ